MLTTIRNFLEKRSHAKRMNAIRASFHSGKPLSRFIARDVRREILIVNIDEIESGFIVAKVRTNNLLYLSKQLAAEKRFGEAKRIPIEGMWNWTGQSWGGLPDGTSIVDHIQSSAANDGETVG